MAFTSTASPPRQTIAVIGSGIAGMSAAWLLSQRHDVTVYEKNTRLGGHSNTVTINTSLGPTPVDTGFIVYNNATYPNLTALFEHLGVVTEISDMSFGVSLNGRQMEYSSVGTSAFLCNGRNLLSPRFLVDDARPIAFLQTRAARNAAHARRHDFARRISETSRLRFSLSGRPFAAASCGDLVCVIGGNSALPGVRVRAFFENHGLLQLKGRPVWRTVTGGSREYVRKLSAAYADRVRLGAGAVVGAARALGRLGARRERTGRAL